MTDSPLGGFAEAPGGGAAGGGADVAAFLPASTPHNNPTINTTHVHLHFHPLDIFTDSSMAFAEKVHFPGKISKNNG